ncbi:hypothetical protein AaE_000399 [Aphanomyces astaci]|uniref:Uncharacterized protein n=1 Tax=Aphanomyces astaci TaxID=112090 RepID=A0A6A5AZI5_APHAT|nr:hypothetical protein AaE_000399 [Aphanomyces astaci]
MEQASLAALAIPPRRRGKYKKTSESAKRRNVGMYDMNGDWAAVAEAKGVKPSTARGWMYLESLTPKQLTRWLQTPPPLSRSSWIVFLLLLMTSLFHCDIACAEQISLYAAIG